MKSRVQTIVILALLAVLLAVPFLFQRDVQLRGVADHQLIIITPHNEQIRYEFGRAFAEWFTQQPETRGETVEVIWSIPGGTSEIRTMLESQYSAALRQGSPLGGAADLLFGGGQYEHDQIKEGVTVSVDGEERHTSISEPVVLPRAFLEKVFGENDLAGNPLYDPDGYWYGTALSSFGIIYNNDVLREIGSEPPVYWRHLCDPRLRGWAALGNPAQSGSIRKSFDTIIQHHGWVHGWRILRRIAANSRGFNASSSKVPIDVSQGDAAAGVCIDFYGRYQQQAIADAGDPGRLGYVDPPGLSAIDADPVSLLRGAPNRDVAEMFIRFTLSEHAQALWQFARESERSVDAGGSGLRGPNRYELRRLPIRRSMYTEHFDRFIDKVDPFSMARGFENPDANSWSFLALVFSALAIDAHDELQDAWEAITTHPAYAPALDSLPPDRWPIVTVADVDDPDLREMLELFDSMPTVPGPDSEDNSGGRVFDLGNPADLAAIKAGWLRGGWSDANLWPKDADPESYLGHTITEFFRGQYRRVAKLRDAGDSRE